VIPTLMSTFLVSSGRELGMDSDDVDVKVDAGVEHEVVARWGRSSVGFIMHRRLRYSWTCERTYMATRFDWWLPSMSCASLWIPEC